MCRIRVDYTILGRSIDFELLDDRIGVKPNAVWRQGDLIPGTILVRQQDGWRISTGHVETIDILALLTPILDTLENAKGSVRSLCESMKLESQLSIVLDLVDQAPAALFSPEVIRRIAVLGCSLDFDITMLDPGA